LSSYRFAA